MLLGKGNQAIFIAIFLLLSTMIHAQGGRSFSYQFGGNLKSDLVAGNNGLTINYSITEAKIESIVNEEGIYYRVSIPDHIPSADPGKPELPVYSKLISIPEGSGYKIRISEIKTAKINPSGKKIPGILYPSQPGETKIRTQEKKIFQIDRKVYGQNGIINTDTARIVSLGKARGNNLANLYISPVRYNPRLNILEIVTSMKIEVIFLSPSVKSSAEASGIVSGDFSASLARSVVNYNRDLIPGFTDKPVGMIILTDTAFRKHLEPFVKWKTQKGFRIQILYRGDAFAGNTYTRIKETLSGIYKSATILNPAPDYLLIVGNVARIPYYGEGGSGNVTDMYYGEFDGNGDYMPEMYVGRLPVADTSELKGVLRKIIQYEKFQFAADNKFSSNALATAGWDDGGHGIYMNGQVNYSVSNYLLKENNIKEHHFNFPQPNLKIQKDSILRIINAGTSFINYTGHGDATGWLYLNLKVADTALMKNRNKYPFIISNACRTAQFNNALSFGNRMVLESYKGAIAFIGCSNDSYWDEDFFWAVGLSTITENPVYAGKGLGIFDRLFHTHSEYPADWYYTIGQINYAGNLSVSASASSRKKYYWETYNVIGDPSIIPIMGEPDSFKISLPDTLPAGIKSLTLTIEPFSYIAISRADTLWDAAFASSSGSVELDMPGMTNDSCLIVVTGQNRYPVIKTIYFSDITEEFLNITSTAINDIQGNNNNKADFGESFYLNLNLSNLGLTDANNVHAIISSGSRYLTIENDSAYIGTIPRQTNMMLNDKLLVRVSENVPDMGVATIDLIIKNQHTEKHYKIDIGLHSPVLQILSCVVDDLTLGNSDYIPDQGETFNLVFKVLNNGSSDASGQFSLNSPSNSLIIYESSVKSGVLKSGEITDISVMVRLSQNISSGTYIPISSTLNCRPFVILKDFSFRVGRVRETFEASTFDVFPWININTSPWTIGGTNPFEGRFSAKSGSIPHNGSTSLIIKALYSSTDSLKFNYKVSSEPNYDFMSFLLNGREIFKKSGDIPWSRVVIPVPAGLNKMEWRYKKDQSTINGNDCAWLDVVDFSITSNVTYIRNDLNVARIIRNSSQEQLGMETMTVKVLNTGKDIINGFNLAYVVNDRQPVRQYFENTVIPNGDSVGVSFSTKMDLSRYGIYRISIFGVDNNDDYANNDSLRIELENTMINESLSVFPNPVKDRFTIFINSKNKDRVRIRITNVSGIDIYNVEKELYAGQNTFIIEDARLIPGIYYLNLNGSFIRKTVTLLKISK